MDQARLAREGEIPTDFGETLPWRYFQYAKEHPIASWNANTVILYANKDNLTAPAPTDEFIHRVGCRLTVMAGGEHWLHTPEQLAVLRNWEEEHT